MLYILSFIVFVHKMMAHALLHISKAGIQIDILHAFHDVCINKGTDFPEGTD